MPVSEATYERVALEDPEGLWELACGRLRRKPDMTTEHNQVTRLLAALLTIQLGVTEFIVSMNTARLRISTGSFYVPDVCVIPMAMVRGLRERPGTFEVYDDPVALVVEVWPPSTGEYDVEEKLREYQLRRDLEIWRVHPYERTLTAWRLRPDGTHAEAVHAGGTIEPIALPRVRIEFARLFN
jgi:Uma2 family endonuclease